MIVKTTFGKCLATSILFKKHSRMHLMKLVVRVGKSYNVNIEKDGEGYKETLHAILKCVICVNMTAECIKTYALTASPRLQHVHVFGSCSKNLSNR